jgi:alpha-N-arabinofuranosidase
MPLKSTHFAAKLTLLLLASSIGSVQLMAQKKPAAQLSIDTTNIVSPVSPTLYGMMTEEINHAFDGGLYAELLSNRTFRPTFSGTDRWEVIRRGDAAAQIQRDEASGPSAALTTSLKLEVTAATPEAEAGITNHGYWGIPVRPHTTYKGSFYAKVADAAIGRVTARLVDDNTGAVVAEAQVTMRSGDWARYQYTLTTNALVASTTNHFELLVAHPGTLWLQLASLMPPTYLDTPNGNRIDLMEKMAAMHPKFLRLPGGNYLEGDRLQDWYNWKKTIGPLVDRPGHQAPWSYYSSDGLGLLEFLEWCEDLKIEPVLAVYAGYSLHGDHIATGKDLEPFVQSAVDEVEYVTGDTSTKWGAERAKDGHPKPFPLHYIEIGNEDEFDHSGSYDARFAQFAKALRKAYPQYKLIATAPTTKSGDDAQPDLLDDHYYKAPADMMDFVHHYDTMSRTKGPKIFIGEWASMSGSPTPNFASALGDAAFMTGLERNSDLILMASYAPLLVNINPGAMQWSPDLVGYDGLKSYGSPSYYAQVLFAGHLGDGTPQSSITDAGERFFYSATVGSTDHVLHLKLVNASNVDQPLAINLHGTGAARPASMFSLHGGSEDATNSMTAPELITPKKATEPVPSGIWHHTVPALTIQVIDIPLHSGSRKP